MCDFFLFVVVIVCVVVCVVVVGGGGSGGGGGVCVCVCVFLNYEYIIDRHAGRQTDTHTHNKLMLADMGAGFSKVTEIHSVLAGQASVCIS
jgi:hypothetical protein